MSLAGPSSRGSDRARLLWLVPLVTAIVVAIELMMTGRFDRTGWIDLAISLVLSTVVIQVAVRLAGRTAVVALVHVVLFTLASYALTIVALDGAGALRAGNTLLVEDGSLTVAGHIHFLSRPFRFGAFTLLLSFLALWGLWGRGPEAPE